MKLQKQKLIRTAIRDRSLLNAYVWHKNKRLSYKTWLNYSLKNDVIIRPPRSVSCQMRHSKFFRGFHI
jgi:hypothetical protein